MKIKFNSDDDLPLKKTLKLRCKIIVVRFVFHKGSKYFPQVFLDEALSNQFLSKLCSHTTVLQYFFINVLSHQNICAC